MEEFSLSPGELLDGSEPDKPRLVMLNTNGGSSLMCLLLRETTDSFLVAFPCKLIKDDEAKAVFVDPYLPVPYARFLKATVSFITPMFGVFEYKYIDYLLNSTPEEMPEALPDIHIHYLLKRMEEIRANNKGENVMSLGGYDIMDSELDMDFSEVIPDNDPEYLEPEPDSINNELTEYLKSLNGKFKH